MKKQFFIFSILSILLYDGTLIAQEQVLKKDSCNASNKYYVGLTSPNSDNTVYTAMQNLWYANEKISYICLLPYFKNLIDPVLPLREGEGKHNKFLFEANIYQQVPIAMGRNHANHFWQTSRLTFDYSLSIRMALDSSNPVLPYNDIIGLNIDKVIWNSHTGFGYKAGDIYAYEDWVNKGISLKNLSMNVTAHHFSNGQQSGFFYSDTISGNFVQRNDYKKGDFSTNYIQIGLTYSSLSSNRNLLSFKVAYQRDGTVVAPLNYSVEQEDSYGHDRIVGFFQYNYVHRKLLNKKLPATIESTCDTCNKKVKAYLYRTSEWIVRMDYEYIMGNLSKYPHTNKYRFNPHLFVEYTRPNWRALGFLVHAYYGRDYSNVRYDLPVFTIMGGLAINFNKYRPAFTDKQRFELVENKK